MRDASWTNVELLTTREAAARLGVGAARVRQLDGVLRPYRTPAGTRIYRGDLVAAFAAARRRAVAP